MNKKWKLLSKKVAFQDDHAVVESWRMRLPNGGEDDFTLVDARGDAVIVFGITPLQQVVVLRQFFMSSQTYEHTLVAGLLEGRDPREVAAKELAEEAGCVAQEFTYLGSSLKGKWALGRFHYYLATDVQQTQPQQLEPAEDINVQLLSVTEFLQILRGGALQDVASVICAYRALDHLKLL